MLPCAIFSSSIQRKESLQLAFESKPLRTICESADHARVDLGETVAETLKHRLADLLAATSVRDIVAGRPRVLPGSAGKDMAVDLCDGRRLVFTANHPSNPMTKDNNLDWGRVSRIRILRIEEDHG